MLRRPEPPEWRVQSTNLGVEAIEFPHSTRKTLLLLLRIQRCMWLISTPQWGRRMTAWEAEKSQQLHKYFFNTIHLLPKDLRFEHGYDKLLLAPGAI